MKINNKIKQYREKIGLTQKQAATKSGVTERMFQHYEAGTKEPSATKIIRIAEALDTKVEKLYETPTTV